MSSDTSGRAFWDQLAGSDPLWAILSDPTRRGRRWDLATFFRTGEREISTLMYQLSRLPGGTPAAREAALDFGCGVGRLSQALARYFASVVGIDVSTTMIGHAERLNQHRDRVSYLLNDQPHLDVVGDRRFDLIYSDLVLQHMPQEQSLRYVGEFLRVLRTGGVLIFQLPSHKRSELAPEITAMPASSYRAGIEIVAAPPAWPRSLAVRVDARVKNVSPEVWDQRQHGALRLGNHWLSEAGEMLVQDDGRAWLPERMVPGEEAGIVLEVNVPDGPCRLLLELDLVHEGYSWFADKGSRPVRMAVMTDLVPTSVSSTAVPDERPSWNDDLLMPFLEPDSEPEVDFPMFGVPRDDLVSFVTVHGGELLLAESDDRGGREWVGFRYFVRRLTDG